MRHPANAVRGRLEVKAGMRVLTACADSRIFSPKPACGDVRGLSLASRSIPLCGASSAGFTISRVEPLSALRYSVPMSNDPSGNLPPIERQTLELSLDLLRILAGKIGIRAEHSDISPDDALRFAQDLMMIADTDGATALLRQDQAGARAFLAMAETPDAALTPPALAVERPFAPMLMHFAPAAAWILEVARRRVARLSRQK